MIGNTGQKRSWWTLVPLSKQREGEVFGERIRREVSVTGCRVECLEPIGLHHRIRQEKVRDWAGHCIVLEMPPEPWNKAFTRHNPGRGAGERILKTIVPVVPAPLDHIVR